jgi:hypothetical protein
LGLAARSADGSTSVGKRLLPKMQYRRIESMPTDKHNRREDRPEDRRTPDLGQSEARRERAEAEGERTSHEKLHHMGSTSQPKAPEKKQPGR